MTLTEFKLVPAKLLEDPATAEFLNKISHKIFEKMRLTPKRAEEPKKRIKLTKNVEVQTELSDDESPVSVEPSSKTVSDSSTTTEPPVSVEPSSTMTEPPRARAFSDNTALSSVEPSGSKERARVVSDTSMLTHTPDKRARVTDIDPLDISLPMEDEDVFAVEGSLTENDLIRLIPTRYKENGLKLLRILEEDYDHTTESGQERLIELINLYLFRHTPSLPQNWMYPVLFDRRQVIKDADIVPNERKKLLNANDLRTLRANRTIFTRSGTTPRRGLEGSGLTSIF
jgi:hypothetical protein